jgi:hypothetical protein
MQLQFAFFLKPPGYSCSSALHAKLHDQPRQRQPPTWVYVSQSHRGCYRSLIAVPSAVPSQSHRSPIGSPIGVCIGVCIGTAISAVPPPSARPLLQSSQKCCNGQLVLLAPRNHIAVQCTCKIYNLVVKKIRLALLGIYRHMALAFSSSCCSYKI